MFRGAALAGLILAAGPAGAEGQIVRGRVIEDATSRGLGQVSLILLDDAGGTLLSFLSDDGGLFYFRMHRPGRFTLRAERPGFRGFLAEAVAVGAQEEVAIELRMAAETIVAAPITVLGRRQLGSPSDFAPRVRLMNELGIGRFLTRIEIDAQRALAVTELLGRVPGVAIEPTPRGSQVLFSSPESTCAPAIYINGYPLTEFSVDRVATPAMIDGIELYHGAGEMQTEFVDPDGCGLMLIWTRPQPADRRSLKWRRAIVYVGMTALGVVLFTR